EPVPSTDVDAAEQHDRQSQRDDDVDHGRRTEHGDRTPARLAQTLDRELQADRHEREDQEPGAQIVDGGDVCLVAAPGQIQRADDRRRDEAHHELREPLPELPDGGPGGGVAFHPQREVGGQRDRHEPDQRVLVVLTMAAIAALTPQIDTAEASSARSLASSPTRPPSHQVNPKTMLISSSACTIAGPAAVTSTLRLTDAPSSINPVLMKNSVRNPPASASRTASRVSTTLPSSPSAIA